MSTMTRFFWAVYYPKRPALGMEAAKPQPAKTDAQPTSVYVYHVDTLARLEVLRRSRGDDARYYRGEAGQAIEPPEFHPTEAAAVQWMDANWARLQAAGAKYAELHSFQVTVGQPADR